MRKKIQTCGITLSLPILLASCGADDSGRGTERWTDESAVSAVIEQEEIDATYVPALNLSVVEGFVRITGDTLLKRSTAQGSALEDDEKCALEAGTELRFTSLGAVSNGHRFLTLERAPAGCGFQAGFLFEGHIELINRRVFYAVSTEETRFKLRLADSGDLTANEWCAIPSGRRLALTGAPVDRGRGHAQVTLAEGQLPGCSFRTGFLFIDHFNQLLDAPQASDFARVMRHILVWEGGCSDHPNDPGGRTYKGITTARARMSGWTRDVCTMPDSLVLDIYRRDYWNTRAVRFAWPLNLAVMNTEVNSGGGRAQEFLDRMNARGIQGSVEARASWFVDQQTAYYRLIASRNPSLRVFLQGWLNRSDYMQDVIAGRVNLFDAEPREPTAKALED